MDTEQLQLTIDPENSRVYYDFDGEKIDLKHYIHNLNTNLNTFLDSKRSWSEGLKLAFKDRFNYFKEKLEELLESGEERFRTDSSGITRDSQGELSNGLNVAYIDPEGNVYTENTGKLLTFDISKELGKYASKIGEAILVKGLTKDYYDLLQKRKIATDAAARQSLPETESLVSDSGINFSDLYNLMSYLKMPEVGLYDTGAGAFNWNGVFALDQSNPELFTNRVSALNNRLVNYYNQILQSALDFSNTAYGSKEAYLALIKKASDALADGYQEADNEVLKAAGLDDDFIGNWFSKISPDERIATAELESRKLELKAKLNANPVNLTNSYNLDNVLTVDNSVSFLDNLDEKIAIPQALNLLASKLGVEAPYHENKAEVANFFEAVKNNIVQGLLTKDPNTVTLLNDLIAYDKILANHKKEGNFIKGDDGLYYLDYRNLNSGIAVVWDGKNKVFLKSLNDVEDSPIYNKLLELINSVPSNRFGGKFADGGELADLTHNAVLAAQGDDKKAYEHGTARFGWNSQGSTTSNENFKLEYEDYARIGALATNIGSMFTDPLSGAVAGLGATAIDLSADVADESLSKWDVAKRFATNLGLDVVSLIPFMESTKIIRGIAGIAGPLTKGLAAYGVLDTINNGEAIISGINNVAKGNFSREDMQNAMQGVMMLAAAVRGGKSLAKSKAASKAASEEGIIGLKVKDKTGKTFDIELEGEAAAQMAEARKNNDIKKALEILNKLGELYPQLKEVTPAQAFNTIPLRAIPKFDLKNKEVTLTNKHIDTYTPIKDDTSDAIARRIRRDGLRDKHNKPFDFVKDTKTPKTNVVQEAAPVVEEKAATVVEEPVLEAPIITKMTDELAEALGENEMVSQVKTKSKAKTASIKKIEEAKTRALDSLKHITEEIALGVTEARKLVAQAQAARLKGFITGSNRTISGETEVKLRINELRKETDKVKSKLENLYDKFLEEGSTLSPKDFREKKAALEESLLLLEIEEGYLKNYGKSISTTKADNITEKNTEAAKEAKKLKEIAAALGIDLETLKKSNTTGLVDLMEHVKSGKPLKIGDKEYVFENPEEAIKTIIDKHQLRLKEGGILKAQSGAVAGVGHKADSSWKNTVGNLTWSKLLEKLKANREYYNWRLDQLTPNNSPATPVTPPENEYETYEPDFNEVYGNGSGNGEGGFGGDDPFNLKFDFKEKLMEKVPDLAEFLRYRWLNRLADKLTNLALEGVKPFLLDPYEVHRKVYGNLRAQSEGLQAAAALLSMAAQPLTSDGQILQAMMLEAKQKGLQYIDAGNKADDAMARETAEKALLQEKDNIYNAWKVAMANGEEINNAEKEENKIEHAGESVKTNNTNTYTMDVIKRARDKAEERSEMFEAATLKDIDSLASLDPSILGIELSPREKAALSAVTSGTKTYSELPANLLPYYLSAKLRVNLAASNIMRRVKGIRVSPFENTIKQALENLLLFDIVDASNDVTFKDGGLITVAKIKEKMRNADRHLKNIHKQIDSLDKKLDRIARSMVSGRSKVANLR